MIHVVTAANRKLYERELDEMHRLRWAFFIDQRGWRDLEAGQARPGYECDEYDDERAVYLLALAEEGGVQGSMRLRPTDDKSLVGDKFPGLIAPEADLQFGVKTWEITRLMRSPEHRGADGELRLRINCAACEFAMSREIASFVCVVDTFLLPAMRALNRDKHRVLGLPQPYAEGEMIALELKPDEEWLARCRALAGFVGPVMYERPAKAAHVQEAA